MPGMRGLDPFLRGDRRPVLAGGAIPSL